MVGSLGDAARHLSTAERDGRLRGRYLASVACTECHAPNLHGYEGDIAPRLAVAKAYTPEAFARLMREGITLAGTPSTPRSDCPLLMRRIAPSAPT